MFDSSINSSSWLSPRLRKHIKCKHVTEQNNKKEQNKEMNMAEVFLPPSSVSFKDMPPLS